MLTDDGSENKGPVIQWAEATLLPSIELLTAQLDIEFSNSMIEAANKQIKYRFLYHQHIPDYAALAVYLQRAVNDYNTRPHAILNGLSPLEVLSGKVADNTAFLQLSQKARAARQVENKQARCCYSF